MDQGSLAPESSLLTAALRPPSPGSVLSVQVPGFQTFLGGLGCHEAVGQGGAGQELQVDGTGLLIFQWSWESRVASLSLCFSGLKGKS